jgi:DNA uptake protein ComE-like DNA-binding protein
MSDKKPSNREIAGILNRIADLLEAQDANPHRVRAYRDGAQSVINARQPVANLVDEEDSPKLKEIPNIGEGLAGVIQEYTQTGRSSLLERLQGEISPVEVITQVPGIGEELAERVVNQLGINSLEELEQAAHDGRLDEVEGFGPRRVEAVRASLAGMLSRSARRHSREVEPEQAGAPPVAMLLDVDEEYRKKAQAEDLEKIAPKRLNPENKAWLPILHTSRGDWTFTALYSNTAQAHRLGKTHDWVVIYYQRKGETEDQVTIVTGTSGELRGKRLVRGREGETRRYYEEQTD